MNSEETNRLDSWKEIAEYLGRDVHTCLRWEKEKGLPVHTIPGGKRRTVYAYKQEIDEWLAKSPGPDEVPAESELAIALPAPSKSSWLRIPNVVRAGFAIAVLGIGGLSVAYTVKELRLPAIASTWHENNKLVAIRPEGGVAWTFDFPFNSASITDTKILPRRGLWEEGGVLATLALGEGNGDELFFFSPRGQQLWHFQPNGQVSFGAGNFRLNWGFAILATYESRGHTKILLATRDHTWWPSELFALSTNGLVEGRFVNSGWILSVHVVECQLGRVVLVGGVSNSFDGNFIAVLDPDRISGTSPESPGSLYECRNCPAERPLKYFVFPRSEVNIVTGASLESLNGERFGDVITVGKSEVPSALGHGNPESVYEFSLDLRLKRAMYGDRYWEEHRKLELEGKIKHSRESCPERNGPPLVRQWDPQNGWQEIYPNQR